MFVISVSNAGKILSTQAVDSETYSAECVMKDNMYYLRCTDHDIITCNVQQTEFTAPCTTQVQHTEGAVIVRFINQYGVAKQSAFTATIFINNDAAPLTIAKPSEVFTGLRV